MLNQEKINFYINKKKITVALLIVLPIIVGLIILFIYTLQIFNHSTHIGYVKRLAQLVAITVILLILLLVTIKLFANKKPLLTITPQEVIIRPILVAKTTIKWQEIAGFTIVQIGKRKNLLIRLYNFNTFLNNQRGLKKLVFNISQLIYPSSIEINTFFMKEKPEALLEILNTYQKTKSYK